MIDVRKILYVMLCNSNTFWGDISFDVKIDHDSNEIIFWLNTYYMLSIWDSKYIKSRSRLNVFKLIKSIETNLNLHKPKCYFDDVQDNYYNNTKSRYCKIVYKVNKDIIEQLTGLVAIQTAAINSQ